MGHCAFPLGCFAFGSILPSWPPSVCFTSQTSAGALATRIRNSPGLTSLVAKCSSPIKCCSAILCFLSPGAQSFTGIWLALAYAHTRRLKRPAMRIKCSLSNFSSDPVNCCHQ